MPGEKQTSKPHQMISQGAAEPRDSVEQSDQARVVVIGIGGNNSDITAGLAKNKIPGITTLIIDTDSLHLSASSAEMNVRARRRRSSSELTEGGDHFLKEASIGESFRSIEWILADKDIAFAVVEPVCGIETKVAQVIAEIARRESVATIAVATVPPRSEGRQRESALSAISRLKRDYDTVLAIDKKELRNLAPELPVEEALKCANLALVKLIKGIVETVVTPCLISLDITRFRTVLECGGIAAIGLGKSNAENRVEEAVRTALTNPLLEIDPANARGILAYVLGDARMTVEEVRNVEPIIADVINDKAQICWSAKIDPQLDGNVQVALVVTGVNPLDVPKEVDPLAHQLFNLEPYSRSEKDLDLDLDLYQMESFES